MTTASKNYIRSHISPNAHHIKMFENKELQYFCESFFPHTPKVYCPSVNHISSGNLFKISKTRKSVRDRRVHAKKNNLKH